MRSRFGTPISPSSPLRTLTPSRSPAPFSPPQASSCSAQDRMVPHLPPEIITYLLAALPTSEGEGRVQTLRACSLVDSTWRDIAQAELLRHIRWARFWPGRMEAFLASPSYRKKEDWRCNSLVLVRAPAEVVWALLSAASAVEELELIGCDARHKYARKYCEVPAGALDSLYGECPGGAGE